MWGILFQCIHISNRHDVHFKHFIILYVHDSSLKLKLKTTRTKKQNRHWINEVWGSVLDARYIGMSNQGSSTFLKHDKWCS